MPFTFSHPAIVLPLSWFSPRWFSVTGLVAGSLTPDFEYFLRMRMQGEYGHTLPGIVVFCLPVGLLLTFLFHNVVRDSLLINLPRFLRSRLVQFTAFNWNAFFRKKWITVVASVVLGAASHIFWDGFTHADGYFVRTFSFLSGNIRLGTMEVEVYRALQHGSTLVGGIVIAAAILSLPRLKTSDAIAVSCKYWALVIGITLVTIVIALVSASTVPSTLSVVVIVISAAMLSLILTPLVLRQSIAR